MGAVTAHIRMAGLTKTTETFTGTRQVESEFRPNPCRIQPIIPDFRIKQRHITHNASVVFFHQSANHVNELQPFKDSIFKEREGSSSC